jgi:hypothetical protein
MQAARHENVLVLVEADIGVEDRAVFRGRVHDHVVPTGGDRPDLNAALREIRPRDVAQRTDKIERRDQERVIRPHRRRVALRRQRRRDRRHDARRVDIAVQQKLHLVHSRPSAIHCRPRSETGVSMGAEADTTRAPFGASNPPRFALTEAIRRITS